jgi:hypothetical protein
MLLGAVGRRPLVGCPQTPPVPFAPVLNFNTPVTALDGRAVVRVSRLKNSLDPIVAMGLGQPTFGQDPALQLRLRTSYAFFFF